MVRGLLAQAAMPARPRLPVGKYLTVRPDRVAPVFAGLPDEVRALLRLCDGTRALRALRDEARLPRRVFDEVIRRLLLLDYVTPGVPRPGDWGRVMAWARDAGQPQPAEPPPVRQPSRTASGEIGFEPTLRMDLSMEDFSLEEEAFFSSTIDHLLEPEERGPQLH